MVTPDLDISGISDQLLAENLCQTRTSGGEEARTRATKRENSITFAAPACDEADSPDQVLASTLLGAKGGLGPSAAKRRGAMRLPRSGRPAAAPGPPSKPPDDPGPDRAGLGPARARTGFGPDQPGLVRGRPKGAVARGLGPDLAGASVAAGQCCGRASESAMTGHEWPHADRAPWARSWSPSCPRRMFCEWGHGPVTRLAAAVRQGLGLVPLQVRFAGPPL